MLDSRRLLVQLQPENQGAPPVSDGSRPVRPPSRPRGGGTVRQLRTFQGLLKNESDARLFAHYLRAQPALIDITGKLAKVGLPDLYQSLSPSPDGKLLLAQRIERPFSCVVPSFYFPRRIEVLALDGKLVYEIARLPLFEGLPTGNDAVPTGVRYIGWRGDALATLVWAEAQDGGDPAKQVAIRDAVRCRPRRSRSRR